MPALRRLIIIAAAALVFAAPAQAFTKTSGTRTMDDGVQLTYDLYQPDGTVPASGFPGVVVLHGLGGSKESVAAIASFFATNGYEALAYNARGHSTSGGNVELAGAREVADERAMLDYFRGVPETSDKVGAWGISYGGGQIWNGLGAGVPYDAAEMVETWTDLYTALFPQDVAKSGIVLGFSKSIDARSPLIASVENDAVHSTNLASLKALSAPRSALPKAPQIKTPVYMFQGRVDYAFDITQASQAFARLPGAKKLYIGQFGHTPSTFPGPDVAYVLGEGLKWYDRYLKGMPNGVDQGGNVTLAAATGSKRRTTVGLPKTKVVGVGFRGTTLGPRLGLRFRQKLETFGVSLLKVQVQKVVAYPRLVATVSLNGKPITHGAVVPRKGLVTIRLANYAQVIAKGARLTVRFGPDSGLADVAYLGFGDEHTIQLGAAFLSLQTLTKPVS